MTMIDFRGLKVLKIKGVMCLSAFSFLSKEMQRKIWDMKWEYFTPVQEQAIPKIINENKHIVISSGTASGKTEAAFLPILSLVSNSAKEKLKVIYVSPLKALINNQFERVEELCRDIDINIHRWHGDIDQGKKKKLVKNPNGILQITPESIESLFINRTEKLKQLFSEVEFIIIDEIHAFLDNERGVQLRSLISRMEDYAEKKPRIIGLSATVENFNFVKSWVDNVNPDNVEIIKSNNSDKELLYNLMHFQKTKDGKIPIELYEDLRDLTRESRSIIFCNSRGFVEETTVFLNRLANKEGIIEPYYAHHSSIDKKEREFVEKTLSSTNEPKSVVSTSSLELGIDIGTIEIVIQMDSTYTVSSLKQRLGRSGRSQDSKQYLQLYSTEKDGLIQSISVMELNLEKWIEPAEGYKIPYDVLFHQIISICQETNGSLKEELIKKISKNNAFYFLKTDEILKLINHMLEKDYLEKIDGSNEIIVGIEGERILRSKEFYAVFTTEEVFEVFEGTRKLGELDKQHKLDIGDNVILTGKLWKIVDVDYEKNKIYVKKAMDAKPPKYFGGPINLHPKIVEKMFEILTCNEQYDYINEEAIEVLKDMRKNYQYFGVNKNDRVIWAEKDEYLFEIFSGSKIINTLILMLRSLGISVKNPDNVGRIYLPKTVKIMNMIKQMKQKDWKEEDLIPFIQEHEMFLTKFNEFIPSDMRVKMHMEHRVDLKETMNYLNKYHFKLIKP